MVKVSVIMPAYNAEKYIGEAIESVINQTFSDWELIIIDDASIDKTLEIANEYAERDKRIRVLRNEKNIGNTKTRNRGIKESIGEYITFLDADDMFNEMRIEEQLNFMTSNDLEVSYCDMLVISSGKNKIMEALEFDKTLKDKLIKRSKEDFDMRTLPGIHLGYKDHGKTIFGGGFFIKKEVFNLCNFDEQLERMADSDLWFQFICSDLRVMRFPKPLYLYRTHGGQITKNVKKIEENAVKINKKLKSGIYFKNK